MRSALTVALVLITGTAGATEAISFKRDLVPVFRTQCATCHLTGQEAGNMKLHPGAAHASLVGVASVESPLLRVKPGAPSDSYLMHKLEGTHLDVGGSGDRMPFGQPQLDAATRDKIRSWIAAGAENN